MSLMYDGAMPLNDLYTNQDTEFELDASWMQPMQVEQRFSDVVARSMATHQPGSIQYPLFVTGK